MTAEGGGQGEQLSTQNFNEASGLHINGSFYFLRAIRCEILHEVPSCCRSYGDPVFQNHAKDMFITPMPLNNIPNDRDFCNC